MACYSVCWKHSAKKELKRLDRQAIARIIAAVEGLAETPYPTGSKKLRGARHLWRIRIGEYRVIYSVASGVLCIEVLRVGHRRSIYK